MAKKEIPRSFNDVLSILGSQRFDVAPAQEGAKPGAKRTPNAFQVRKYGCAAEIAAAPDGSVQVLSRPGWLLGGEIARLLDRGYQKFLKTSKLEIPAHAHRGEPRKPIRPASLYNESLGTTSDVYQYDRVNGRE